MVNTTKYAVFRSKNSIRKGELISWSLIICVALEVGSMIALLLHWETTLKAEFMFNLSYMLFHIFLEILMIIICVYLIIILRSVHKELSTIHTERHALECASKMEELKRPKTIEPRLTQTSTQTLTQTPTQTLTQTPTQTPTQTLTLHRVARSSMHEYDFIKNESISSQFDLYSEITDPLIPPKGTENPIVENQHFQHLPNSNSQSVLQQNFGNTITKTVSTDFKLNTKIKNDVIPLSHTLNKVNSFSPTLERFSQKPEFESSMNDLDRIITKMQSNDKGNNVENLAVTNWKDDEDYDYIKN